MNIVDLIIIVIFTISAISGFRRSFLGSLFDLSLFIVSILFAYILSFPGSWVIKSLFNINDNFAPFIAFMVMFFILDILLGWFVKTHFMKKVKKFNLAIKGKIKFRFGGMVVYWIRDFLLVALAVNFLLFLPLMPQVRSAIVDAKLTPIFTVTSSIFEGAFSQLVSPAVGQLQEFITTTTITDESVDIEMPVGELAPDFNLAQEMLELVNEERISHGLPVLTWREDLAQVALKHSRDMWERQFFGHINPDEDDPFDRLDEDNVPYLAAGENLAIAPSLNIAHKGLMDSPSHRENILQSEFRQIGIGVIVNSPYGAMYTQIFSD